MLVFERIMSSSSLFFSSTLCTDDGRHCVSTRCALPCLSNGAAAALLRLGREARNDEKLLSCFNVSSGSGGLLTAAAFFLARFAASSCITGALTTSNVEGDAHFAGLRRKAPGAVAAADCRAATSALDALTAAAAEAISAFATAAADCTPASASTAAAFASATVAAAAASGASASAALAGPLEIPLDGLAAPDPMSTLESRASVSQHGRCTSAVSAGWAAERRVAEGRVAEGRHGASREERREAEVRRDTTDSTSSSVRSDSTEPVGTTTRPTLLSTTRAGLDAASFALHAERPGRLALNEERAAEHRELAL